MDQDGEGSRVEVGTDPARQGVQEQEREPSGHSLPSPALLFSGNTLKVFFLVAIRL